MFMFQKDMSMSKRNIHVYLPERHVYVPEIDVLEKKYMKNQKREVAMKHFYT